MKPVERWIRVIREVYVFAGRDDVTYATQFNMFSGSWQVFDLVKAMEDPMDERDRVVELVWQDGDPLIIDYTKEA